MRLPRKKKRGETKEKTFITGVKTWNLTPWTRKIIPFLRSSSRTDPRHSGLHVEQENQISPVLLVHLCLPQGQRALSEPAPLPGWSFTTSETAQTPQNKTGEDDWVQPRYRQVSWRDNPVGKPALALSGSLHVQSQWWTVQWLEQLQNSGLTFFMGCLCIMLDKYTDWQRQGISQCI